MTIGEETASPETVSSEIESKDCLYLLALDECSTLTYFTILVASYFPVARRLIRLSNDNSSAVDCAHSFSVLLCFFRSLDALNIEEGPPIIDDGLGSAENLLMSSNETNTLSHLAQLSKNLFPILVARCHFLSNHTTICSKFLR